MFLGVDEGSKCLQKVCFCMKDGKDGSHQPVLVSSHLPITMTYCALFKTVLANYALDSIIISRPTKLKADLLSCSNKQ